MKNMLLLALICAAILLCGCRYMVIEARDDAPAQSDAQEWQVD